MTKRTTTLIGLLGLALGAFILCARAPRAIGEMGPHHGHHGHGMAGAGRLIPGLLWSTDLTADQQTQVHQILDANRPTMEQLAEQLHQATKAFGHLMLAGQPPQADAVSAQLAAIAQLQQQLAQNEANTVMSIRALLTPDQLAKADAAIDHAPPWHGRKPCAGEHDS